MNGDLVITHDAAPTASEEWREVSLWCTTWRAAEQLGITAIGPRLNELTDAQTIVGWWFIRKTERWKIRYLPARDTAERATSDVAGMLDDLKAEEGLSKWAPTIYEPESEAFGGLHGMDTAHRLFHTDSRHVLAQLGRRGDEHQRELGILLVTAMMRGAGMDWYEQGHVWRLVAQERTVPAERPASGDAETVHRFLTVDTHEACAAMDADVEWFNAFTEAGRRYAALAERGLLTRGLRAVLAQHVLFAWNRLGLPEAVQGALAEAAGTAVFDAGPARHGLPNHKSDDAPAARVGAVTTDTTGAAPATPEQLRDALADHIRGRGTFRTAAVERAFRTVPREVFLDGVTLEEAYRPRVVVTKRAEDGSAISSASDPNLVATQAEDLDVRPGHQILEIGAATGINAAILAELTGPSGRVVTVEIDQDLADGAQAALGKAGYSNVTVICGDGAAGWADAAPYDRIIVTAGAWDIPRSWWDQLAPGGRIVVPIRLHGSGLTRSLALDLRPTGELVASHTRVCGFVPMRGDSAADATTAVTLADHVTLSTATIEAPDEPALARALTHRAYEQWTGINVTDHEPVEHLDLWLATTTPGFARLSVSTEARKAGIADPALRWAGAGLYDGGTIAYLAARPHGPVSRELGVVAHGPDSGRLTTRLIDLLQDWNHTRPARPIITAHRAGAPGDRLGRGVHIDRPDSRLTVTW